MQESVQTYEITAWLLPPAEGTDGSSGTDILRSAITSSEGIIVSESKPFIKKLAYPVKKRREAIFSIITAKLSPAAASNITQRLKNSAEILRISVIKNEPRKTRMRRPIVLRSRTPKGETTESAKEPLAESRPEVKMEELDKKLEELLQKP